MRDNDDDISGEMWTAGRRMFETMAARWRDATTSSAADIVADVAPAEIWKAMNKLCARPTTVPAIGAPEEARPRAACDPLCDAASRSGAIRSLRLPASDAAAPVAQTIKRS